MLTGLYGMRCWLQSGDASSCCSRKMIGWKSIAALRGGDLAHDNGSFAANFNPTGTLRPADVVVPCLLARRAIRRRSEVLAGPGLGPQMRTLSSGAASLPGSISLSVH
jgi:hypothetical protein